MSITTATSPAPAIVRYVDEKTCLNSIIVSSIACVISVAFAAVLFRRAFAEQLGHQFMASDSTIRFMTKRCRLLYFAAVLNAVDAASNVIQWIILYQATQLVDFLLIRIIYMLSFVAALPLQTYATCQRCAVIIAREHVKRNRLLNTAFRTCVLSFVVMEVGVVYNIITLVAAGSKTTVQDWLTVTYMPLPVVGFLVIMPLLIMLSSSWALSVNVRRGNQSGSLPASGSTVGHRASLTTPPTVVVVHPAPVAGALKHSPAPAASSTSHIPTFRARSRSFLLRSPSNHTSSRSQLSYPLSISFIILTMGLIILWSIGLTASLFPIFPHMRRSPVNALVNSGCLALEASFERLLKLAKQKHHRRQSRQAAATAGFQGDEEEEEAESGVGEGMSGSGIETGSHPARIPRERPRQLELEVTKEEDESCQEKATGVSASGAVVLATARLEPDIN